MRIANPNVLFQATFKPPDSPDIEDTWADIGSPGKPQSPEKEPTPVKKAKAVKVANLQEILSNNKGRAKNKGIKRVMRYYCTPQ
jgi:hypothetical protein